MPLASWAPRSDGTVVPYDAAPDAPERIRRSRLFCAAYGRDADDELLATVERCIEAMCETLIERAANGDAAFKRLIAEGHLGYYRGEIAFIRRHAGEWRAS